ncbi:MAG: hypothetical protein ACTTIV_04045 [Campylobacter sp.]
MHNLAKKTLESLGHKICKTAIDESYELEAEVGKFLWMGANR